MRLTDEEKWSAFACGNADYDGLYLIAVKTTCIVCKPSCRARLPRRKNVVFYDTLKEASANGFRPCKLCRPDLLDYRPLREAAEQARALIENSFDQQEELMEKLTGLGISFNHLSVIFRREYHMTPFAYRNQLRADNAARMLHETDRPIADIAFTSGFGSLSAFYRFFKIFFGVPPREYRLKVREKNL